ncbi:ATP-binding protein [Legionella sp.]|uniref:ATP-binding protein n=1 Tax=Legionella sp. TaxID=459 RepID=UPI00257A21A3|nr:ATP-binding protein [Legionella sp.]
MMNFEEEEKLQKIIAEKDKEIARLKASLEQEKLKIKNELQATQDYYESILAVMPGHVYWLDKNNVFLGCNDLQAANAKLQSRKEIVGKTNFDLPWKDQAEELNRLNNLVMESGMPHTAEEYAVMVNGLAIYFSQKTPLRDKNNKIIGVLGVSIDITERKKMEVALRRAKEAAEVANHAKTEFIANMSHDIHTPLSGILGLSKLLEDKLQSPEEKQYTQWISESGRQLLELLNRVLQVVSDDNLKETEVNEEIVDLRQLTQGIIHLMLPAVKIKNLDLVFDIDDAVPEKLITDGQKLQRILLNLLSNAIKFTEKGTITLKLKVVVDDTEYVQLQFSVQDTGIGIPDELQTQIFDRFFRIETSCTNEQNELADHGVGLHVAQNYVVLLGGEINLESKLGKGSIFYFTLPMKVINYSNGTDLQNAEIVKESPLFFTEMATSESSPFVLLIETNEVALRFLEGLCVQTGCRFLSASDREQVLQLVKEKDFDLIITDVESPRISADELTHSIRKWEKSSDKNAVPIVGLTSHALDTSEGSLPSGMNKIISKPVDLVIMQKLLREFGLLKGN